ncbi:MAG: DCC1-like thiol-disulfide oxidoreductase family protein [Nitrososphaerales archaeon]
MPYSDRLPARSHFTYLLYDSGCGPCTSFMKLVAQLDVHRQILPVSFYAAGAAKLAGPSMSRRRLFSSFHLVEISKGKREVFSAGDGAIRLTKYLPLGSLAYKLVARTKFLRTFIRRLYFQATRIRAASTSCRTN